VAELDPYHLLFEERHSSVIRRLDKIEAQMVTRDDFALVRNIAYGLAGSILLGFLSLLMTLIGWRPGGTP